MEMEMLHIQAEMEAMEMERVLAMSLALEEEKLYLMQTELEEIERRDASNSLTFEAESKDAVRCTFNYSLGLHVL